MKATDTKPEEKHGHGPRVVTEQDGNTVGDKTIVPDNTVVIRKVETLKPNLKLVDANSVVVGMPPDEKLHKNSP